MNSAALMLETSMAIKAVNNERADKLWNSTGLDRRHLGFCTKEKGRENPRGMLTSRKF